MMKSVSTSNFLRWVLFADAATCLASGLLLTLGASALEQSMGMPARLLQIAGATLFPFAALLVYLAKQKNAAIPVIWAVIILNAIWTFDSILLLLAGWIEPTTLGAAFVLFQAIGVALFATLEYVGLRKSVA